jgi:hypothetical protein
VKGADFIGRLTRELEAAGVPYMIAGSFASTFYGEPRTTRDVDIVIHADERGIRALLARLPADDYYVNESTALDAVRRQTQFNVIDVATGWKADLIQRKSRPFSRSEFERRREVILLGMRVWMATSEDVVVSKLEWAQKAESERQLRDVASVVKARVSQLDMAYIEHWVAELNLTDLWNRVRGP